MSSVAMIDELPSPHGLKWPKACRPPDILSSIQSRYVATSETVTAVQRWCLRFGPLSARSIIKHLRPLRPVIDLRRFTSLREETLFLLQRVGNVMIAQRGHLRLDDRDDPEGDPGNAMRFGCGAMLVGSATELERTRRARLMLLESGSYLPGARRTRSVRT